MSARKGRDRTEDKMPEQRLKLEALTRPGKAGLGAGRGKAPAMWEEV